MVMEFIKVNKINLFIEAVLKTIKNMEKALKRHNSLTFKAHFNMIKKRKVC